MTLPSFESGWKDSARTKPRIYILEVCDRDRPGSAPIAWLLVERAESDVRDGRDNSICSASIRLSYERIESKISPRATGLDYFSGAYSRGFNGDPCVSLTSESMGRGAVFLDPPELQGHRVGTYLMNEIVTWARQWPDATVRPVELLEGQADDGNRARRNRFYEQFGLVFDYRDPEHREGLSRPMLANALIPIETWKDNLRERDVRDFLRDVLYKFDRMKFELSQRELAVENLRDELQRAEAKPARWALRRMWWKLSAILGPVVVLLFVAATVWALK